jgi:hypothetical protein
MDNNVTFIGRVEEKTFSNGGSILKLSLSDKDKALFAKGYTNLVIAKSKAGKWYCKVDDFVPRTGTQTTSSNTDEKSDLPF